MPETQVKEKGILATIERIGNKMPHPMLLFVELIIIIMVLSAVFSFAGVSVTSPTDGSQVFAYNLLSKDGLMEWVRTFIDNFQAFPVLAIVLIMGVATGICERTGYFDTVIRMSLANVKGTGLIFFVSLISMSGVVIGDASMILIPTLAAAIFYSTGRNPLVGIIASYAAVTASFGTMIIPGGFDPMLTPVTITAAQVIDPSFDMPLMTGYFILFATAIVITTTTTFVTVKIIEPMFGKYTGTPEGVDPPTPITDEQRSAAKKASIIVGIYVLLIIVACIPPNSFFRNADTGSLVVGAPLMASLRTIIMLLFFIPGFAYGIITKKIKSAGDLYMIMVESLKGLAGFAVLGIFIGQFLYLFSKSNLGTLLSVAGGDVIKSANMPTQVIVLIYFTFIAFMNLFIISGSTKYLMLAPIFVPMFMQLGLHPSLAQAMYKIADGMTTCITPLNSMFIVVLALCSKYDKKCGMGKVFSGLIPYSAVYFVSMAIVVTIWITLNLPLGITGRIYM